MHRWAERRVRMGPVSRFISGLVSEEIRRIVGEAAKDGRVISAADTAAMILRTYPTCGFAESDIADEVMITAGHAGVAVEIGRQPSFRSKPTLIKCKALTGPRHLH